MLEKWLATDVELALWTYFFTIPVVLQGVLPTREEMAEKAQLAEARDKLVKLVVSSIMDYRMNSIPAAAACLHVLSTLVHNVLSSPSDPKMRQVR